MHSKDLLIIEDDPDASAYIKSACCEAFDFKEIHQALSFKTGQQAIDTLPDLGLVLCDIGLPDGDGLNLVAQSVGLGIPTVVVSVLGNETTVLSAIEYGAIGYLHKELDADQIVTAIQQVLGGASPLSPSIASHVLRRLRQANNDKPQQKAASTAHYSSGTLTNREVQVLQLIAHGYQYNEVADQLNISIHTVGNHNRNIYRKLGVRSRTEAVYSAHKSGILKSSY